MKRTIGVVLRLPRISVDDLQHTICPFSTTGHIELPVLEDMRILPSLDLLQAEQRREPGRTWIWPDVTALELVPGGAARWRSACPSSDSARSAHDNVVRIEAHS